MATQRPTSVDERVEQLLAQAPPLTDEQAYAAARILASVAEEASSDAA